MKNETSVLKDILSNPHPSALSHGDTASTPKDKLGKEKTFWDTIGTRMYSGMAAKLESDQPAYSFIANLVVSFLVSKYSGKSLSGAKILDFGCHNGSSTSLYADLTKEGVKVIGVDSNPIVIAEAQLKFSDIVGLEFRTTLKGQVIPFGNVDVILATFVHPTISSREELELIINNVYKSLAPKGMFVLLGLNSESFGGNYLSYKHELKYGPYEDGRPFRNTLVLPDGSSLSFDDYCWTNKTLKLILNKSGFREVDVITLNTELRNDLGNLFKSSLAQVETRLGKVEWGDEWGSGSTKGGLFDVVVAFKN